MKLISKDELLKAFDEGTTVGFNIVGIAKNGFYCAISDLRGYVSFEKMPFWYGNPEIWSTIFPFLKHIPFFGKIVKIGDDGNYLVLDASIPQFKKFDLSLNSSYNGVLINKLDSHVILELGPAFRWKYGSILASLPNEHTDSLFNRKLIQVGDSIPITILEKQDQTQNYKVRGSRDSILWETENLSELLHKITKATCIRKENKLSLVLFGKHYGVIKQVQEEKFKKKILSLRKLTPFLKHGDVITCKIIEVNKQSKQMSVIWLITQEEQNDFNIPPQNAISNLLPLEVIEQLNSQTK